jgi:peptidoglycan/LPS O-acetylase OafA/YrhL
MNDYNISTPRRFYSLDVARGIAALIIVFWHWQHFFFKGTVPGNPLVSNFPFYNIFFTFYKNGFTALNFFFTLSGFIFYWLYANQIKDEGITARNFIVLRFSRLYPLHLATLIIVLVGQKFFYSHYGEYFIYAYNDVRHFVLNLFFVSYWGVQKGFSFNGPVWSVSIEVLLYCIFFLVCRIKMTRPGFLILFVILGLAFTPINELIGGAVFLFFMGGLTYYLYLKILNSGKVKNWEIPLMVAMFVGWSLVVLETKFDLIQYMLQSSFKENLVFNGHSYFQGIMSRFPDLILRGFLIPLTVLTLVVTETRRGHLGQRVSFLGDISYSVYLIHFPLQLLFINLMTIIGIKVSFFYSGFSMILFFSILITLSLLSYNYLEMPAQKILRRRLLKK